jgi:hypothetical protein
VEGGVRKMVSGPRAWLPSAERSRSEPARPPGAPRTPESAERQAKGGQVLIYPIR